MLHTTLVEQEINALQQSSQKDIFLEEEEFNKYSNAPGLKLGELFNWDCEDNYEIKTHYDIQLFIQSQVRNYYLILGNNCSAVEMILSCPLTVNLEQWKCETFRYCNF